MNVRRHIEVSGIVQGVGFRPHVYRLARERALAGEISNTPSGVTIEVQGPQETIDDFVVRLRQEAPPLAKITGLAMADLPCNGDREFRILASRRGEAVHTLISPDVAICDDTRVPANSNGRFPSVWVVMGNTSRIRSAMSTDQRWLRLVVRTPKLWTDDFSNILGVLR